MNYSTFYAEIRDLKLFPWVEQYSQGIPSGTAGTNLGKTPTWAGKQYKLIDNLIHEHLYNEIPPYDVKPFQRVKYPEFVQIPKERLLQPGFKHLSKVMNFDHDGTVRMTTTRGIAGYDKGISTHNYSLSALYGYTLDRDPVDFPITRSSGSKTVSIVGEPVLYPMPKIRRRASFEPRIVNEYFEFTVNETIPLGWEPSETERLARHSKIMQKANSTDHFFSWHFKNSQRGTTFSCLRPQSLHHKITFPEGVKVKSQEVVVISSGRRMQNLEKYLTDQNSLTTYVDDHGCGVLELKVSIMPKVAHYGYIYGLSR